MRSTDNYTDARIDGVTALARELLSVLAPDKIGALGLWELKPCPSHLHVPKLLSWECSTTNHFTETGDHDQADGEHGAPRGLDACSFLTRPFPAAQTAENHLVLQIFLHAPSWPIFLYPGSELWLICADV